MLTVTDGSHTWEYSITGDGNDYWEKVGEAMLKCNVPCTIKHSSEYGEGEIKVIARQTYTGEDAHDYPSPHISSEYNNVYGLTPVMPPAETMLKCINSDYSMDTGKQANMYKFYQIFSDPDGLRCVYGRIAQEEGQPFGKRTVGKKYDPHLFWLLYNEKIRKRYIDTTSIDVANSYSAKPAKSTSHPAKETPASKLYNKLLKYSRHVVRETLVNEHVTEAQVKECRKILRELGERKTVRGFNKQLKKLLLISPRKARYISTMMADDVSDFPSIIEREEDLIMAMEGCMVREDPFGDIEVYEATAKQKKKVIDKLSDQLKGKVKAVYRVIPRKQKGRFDSYLNKNHLSSSDVKELWHGSRNENWLSIIINSLMLNPNAQITGKMFGNGIYFAPSSTKSWGYTSYYGTYWANGNQNTAFMGLYATAYGKPYMVHSSGYYSEADLKRVGKNCVHATPNNTGLRNDEIIFYNESAMLLNYIVEFEG